MESSQKAPAAPSVSTPNPAELLRDFIEKDRKARAAELAARPDLWTGKKVCSRFMIPASYMTPKMNTLSKVDPNHVEMQLNLQMGNCNCIGAKCQMWDATRKQCHEVTQSEAMCRIGDLIELIDGFMRLPSTDTH